MRAETTSAICARDLCKAFGSHVVLHDITFDVAPGTIVGFIGPSGCGKTTLVRLITGMYRPTSGQITVNGTVPWLRSRNQRRDVGYLPQTPVLFEELSVRHNLNFHASLSGVRVRRRRRVDEMLEFVELTDDDAKRVRDISGGMQRRLALAAALVHDPSFIVLDEPTAGIDPILRKKFWDQFRSLRDDDRTLVVTTQYVGEAAYCDQVAVVSDGELIAIDAPEALRRKAFGADLLDITTIDSPSDAQIEQIRQIDGVFGPPLRIGPDVLRVPVDDATTRGPLVSAHLDQLGVAVASSTPYVADFDDVFIRLIEQHRAALAGAAQQDAR